MLIYDVGMHNGDDTHYYLMKGATVVGVEANPQLVAQLAERFAAEIEAGRLHLIGKGVGYDEGVFPFYVAPNNAQQSSFVQQRGFSKIDVEIVRLSALFAQFGLPDFAKIDVEHMDIHVLRDLLDNNVVPPHISVEAHSFAIILFLYKMNFTKFRLLNGRLVSQTYKNHSISTPDNVVKYSFPNHSSGPFGDDLPLPWVNIEQVCAHWMVRTSLTSPGWYDVHATGLQTLPVVR